MKKEDDENCLIFHRADERQGHGALVLSFLLACGFVVGLFCLVSIERPERIRAERYGVQYYRNDDFMHFEVRQRSPLPLQLPKGAEPARAVGLLPVPELPLRREPVFVPAPPNRGVNTSWESSVLSADELLALPEPSAPAVAPAPTEPAPAETAPVTPVSATGEEVPA